MVIGNGLIANRFKRIALNENVLLFASGVSNSKEFRRIEFDREEFFLRQCIELNLEKHIVYFSTCSIQSSIETAYIKHKINMELLIQKNSPSYSIFRLPQVVGETKNETLISTIFKKILTNSPLVVHKYAVRNLLDVDDLVRIVSVGLKTGYGLNQINNVASSSNVGILELVNEISDLLKIPVNINLEPLGYCENISLNYVISLLGDDDKLFIENYWKLVIKKYTKWFQDNYKN
jgi:nucleoside-diphosphate-sugar epimerase